MKLPWVMRMAWRDLLFMHWPVPSEALTPHLPPEVRLDHHDGQAFLGVLPFTVDGFQPRGVPLRRTYAQVNLRTYVRVRGVAGIWTFSLDAADALSVLGARLGYRLPYYQADVELAARDGWLRATSVRRHDPRWQCDVAYRPNGPLFHARLGTLEHWLTERRSLFTVGWGGQLWRADVQHEPWPLRTAEVNLRHSTLPGQLGVQVQGEPLAHYARAVHVRGWPPVRA